MPIFWLVTDGLFWLGFSVALIGMLVILPRYYRPYLDAKVAALNVWIDTYSRSAAEERDASELRSMYWLCFVGHAGDVYGAWAKVCEVDGNWTTAISYVHRALRMDASGSPLDLQVLLVKLYTFEGQSTEAEQVATHLISTHPDDMFLRYRLETILGAERIALIH